MPAMSTAAAQQSLPLSTEGLVYSMDSWKEYLCAPKRSVRVAPGDSLCVLDVFSGVGGLALGFERAAQQHGLETTFVGAVDTDEGAVETYRRNLRTEVTVTTPVSSLVDF